jgi:hypothetical protein
MLRLRDSLTGSPKTGQYRVHFDAPEGHESRVNA